MLSARLDRTGDIRSVPRWPVSALALLLAGCAVPFIGSPASPDPAAIQPAIVTATPSTTPPGAGGARPRFFVQWKNDLPGLTRRPSVSEETEPPEYPAIAVREEFAGITTLETCVTLEGRLADIHIIKSSGFPVLDTATLDWAVDAKFLPAVINGEPFAICGYRFDHVWQVAE
jgi:protein TonB